MSRQPNHRLNHRRGFGWGRLSRAALLASLLALHAIPGQGAGQGAEPVRAPSTEVTDDRGRATRWAAPPQRIVSLLPSLTETVCALDACNRLVGVDRYSTWPEPVTHLTQVGGGLDPNLEAIVALRPDVVLLATSSRAADRLEALGITVVALEPRTHADVQRVLRTVAQLLGLAPARADDLWTRIDSAITAAANTIPVGHRGARVYFEINGAPYAAGPGSFIGETLERLGAKNIVTPDLGPFPRLNPEYVVRANPDVILVGDRHASGLMARPGWGRIRAVREKRLCVFPAAESDAIVRPGPRMVEGAQAMARCLAQHAP